jgi:peptidoglycan/xylan/chitin deacetylase (PgdA/CDA1 family)
MWLDRLLSRSPLQALSRRCRGTSLPVLAYHDIEDSGTFEEQIQYLTREMVPLSVEALVTAIEHGTRLPEHAVLITFDDGYRSVVEKAMPILMQYQVPAVVFVVTGLLDSDLPFWWEEAEWLLKQGATSGQPHTPDAHLSIGQLKAMPDQTRIAVLAQWRQAVGGKRFSQPQLRADELAILESAGITIGNHTHTHPCLNRCDSRKIRQEIRTSHDRLASLLGHPPIAFAYPNGDWEDGAEQTLVELGYQVGFMFDHRVSPLPPKNPLRISRLRVSTSTGMERFKLIVSGVHPAVHHAIGRR